MTVLQKNPAVMALGLLALTLITWVGISDFYTRGEAREALIVQSMVSHGQYVLPRGYNGAVPSKPPLFHWAAALTSHLIGEVNEFSLRAPSAIFAVGTLVFFLFFLKAELNSAQRLLFIAFLSFSFEWLRASVSARVDMVHAATLSCGLLSAYLATERGGFGYWILVAILIAMATLAKGPVAIVLTFFVLVAWLISSRGFSNIARTLLMLCAALTTALALALLWYVAAYLNSPGDFFSKFWSENVERFAGITGDQPHHHSALYLIAMLILGTLPGSLLIIWALFKQRRRPFSEIFENFIIWALFKKKPRPFEPVLEKWRALSSLEQFSVIATSTIVLFYCIPASKRGVYLLASYPFIALSATFLFERCWNFSCRAINRVVFAGCLVVVFAQAIIVPKFVAPRSSERTLAKAILEDATDKNPIYSYGFEFYGASFYSKMKFLRLESQLDKLTEKKEALVNSILVFFSPRLDAIKSQLEGQGLGLRIINQIPLGSDKAIIARPQPLE